VRDRLIHRDLDKGMLCLAEGCLADEDIVLVIDHYPSGIAVIESDDAGLSHMINQFPVPIDLLIQPDAFRADVLALHRHHQEVELGDLDLAAFRYPGSTKDLIGCASVERGMRSLAITEPHVEGDHLHRFLNGRWFTRIELLSPGFVAMQNRGLIVNRGTSEGGDEPLKLLLEGLEEAFDDLGLGIVALSESHSDIEPGEDPSQFLVQVMLFPSLMKELGSEGLAVIQIDILGQHCHRSAIVICDLRAVDEAIAEGGQDMLAIFGKGE